MKMRDQGTPPLSTPARWSGDWGGERLGETPGTERRTGPRAVARTRSAGRRARQGRRPGSQTRRLRTARRDARNGGSRALAAKVADARTRPAPSVVTISSDSGTAPGVASACPRSAASAPTVVASTARGRSKRVSPRLRRREASARRGCTRRGRLARRCARRTTRRTRRGGTPAPRLVIARDAERPRHRDVAELRVERVGVSPRGLRRRERDLPRGSSCARRPQPLEQRAPDAGLSRPRRDDERAHLARVRCVLGRPPAARTSPRPARRSRRRPSRRRGCAGLGRVGRLGASSSRRAPAPCRRGRRASRCTPPPLVRVPQLAPERGDRRPLAGAGRADDDARAVHRGGHGAPASSGRSRSMCSSVRPAAGAVIPASTRRPDASAGQCPLGAVPARDVDEGPRQDAHHVVEERVPLEREREDARVLPVPTVASARLRVRTVSARVVVGRAERAEVVRADDGGSLSAKSRRSRGADDAPRALRQRGSRTRSRRHSVDVALLLGGEARLNAGETERARARRRHRGGAG